MSTYVLPTLAFPAEVRSTLHGVSAACGKLGGIAGTATFTSMLASYEDSTAVQHIMMSCAALAAVGGTLTLFGIEGAAVSFCRPRKPAEARILV